MTTFLEQLAEALLREHGGDLERVAVVLPSRRAGLYLRAALARSAGKAMWSPDLYTLPSFMERLAGLRTMPMEELLLEAYGVYRGVTGPDARSLDDFMEWAPVTLADMSEADANMVGLEGFYRDLRSWEELDWSFNTDPLSEGQQRMVRYWTLAGKLHLAVNERLLAMGAGTSGLVERRAAERGATAFTWDRIWFAGLNAFTAAEQRILDEARDKGLGVFAWDADQYYIAAKEQEAGAHLRKAIQRYGPGAIPLCEALRSAGPTIEVRSAPNAVAQAWCAVDRLRAWPDDERSRTAVVLADEALLPALLEALPSELGQVNVTMGMSLAGLPVGSLLDLFFRCCSSTAGDGTWPTEAIIRILGHPFVRGPGLDGRMEEVISALRRTGGLRMRAEELQVELEQAPPEIQLLMRTVFAPGPEQGIRARAMALLARARRAMGHDDFAVEQIYQASVMLDRTTDLLERYGHDLNGAAWTAVMTRLLRTARIGLYGEPLSGLQVMGLLEARGLDPRHIILLGAQEGKLPMSSFERSYIPFELRRAHGLPLRDSGDAVQAYNFLRLIQRAQDVLLVHDGQNASGPSRHIAQLRHELFAERPERMAFSHARVPLPEREAAVQAVPHDEGTLDRVRTLLEQGISPTMLRAWLRCPLDFWFRYVCGLREPDAAGARIGSDVLGNALHAVLEDVHRPWLGRPLDAAAVEAMIPGSGEAIRNRLLQDIPAERLRSGQPLLQTGMATRAAENFLREEARALHDGMHLVPRALETALLAPLPVSGLSLGGRVIIKGRLDRVDERDGIVHILDLKTGRVDESSLRIQEISIDALKGDKGHAAQLLVYAWLYLTLHPEVMEVRAGLQPLQRVSGSAGIYLRIGDRDLIQRSDLPAITDLLTGTVRTLLDPATVFSHDTESPFCSFCAQAV